jgi:hypothetical protein
MEPVSFKCVRHLHYTKYSDCKREVVHFYSLTVILYLKLLKHMTHTSKGCILKYYLLAPPARFLLRKRHFPKLSVSSNRETQPINPSPSPFCCSVCSCRLVSLIHKHVSNHTSYRFSVYVDWLGILVKSITSAFLGTFTLLSTRIVSIEAFSCVSIDMQDFPQRLQCISNFVTLTLQPSGPNAYL